MTTKQTLLIVVLAGLVLSLVLAGIFSPWASSHPDGLEYAVEQVGTTDDAPEAVEEEVWTHAPFPDYDADGSTGLAGIIGVAVTFLAIMLLSWLTLRGRRSGEATTGEQTTS